MPFLRWTPSLLLVGALLVGAGCAKRADEAPAETAASQAPAPAEAPEGFAAPESPAAPAAAPPPPAPAGGAPPSSLEPEPAPKRGGLARTDEDFSSIAEAEKAFAESSQDLDKLLGPLAKQIGGRAPAPLASGDTRCPRACKAFDSLRRSGDAICRLAGDADARCTRARDVVEKNKSRVAACGCDTAED